jgi:hippurate hydrolase
MGARSTLTTRTADDTELLRGWRRDLHRIPECGFDLPETLAYVRTVLDGLVQDSPAGRAGILSVLEPSRGCICAYFDRGGAPATAFRADFDALPITERTGAPYASTHPGRMHACGHDGHAAMLLGLARRLALDPQRLRRGALLVFQPAEEAQGGSQSVCESGVLERCGVDRMFGMHLWPGLAAGAVASRPGTLFAAGNEVDVGFSGTPVHIARHEEGADALAAAARFLTEVYRAVDELAREEPLVLRFGCGHAGQVRNQVAGEAVLSGSLRTLSDGMRARAMDEVRRVAHEEAAALGCTARVGFSQGNPTVSNDAGLLEVARGALPDLARVSLPTYTTDDFAWYQRRMPGAYLLLGAGTQTPLHSDRFDFDESVLAVGLDALERLALLP